jgi:benzoyl-CoA reductase/2-hydroxyglutaryl-CoA dehydratase subunit BcrC/BadD/HgdB
MKAMERLSSHLETRLDELGRLRGEGRRIIGYTPGGFLPEELVLAAGAVPVGLIRGGEHDMVEYANRYICRWIDTFCRAQIGYGISGKDPYYKIIDLLAVPMTDNHIRAVMDILDYNTDIEVFPFGVPHTKDELTTGYYRHGINKLRNKIEEVTGNEITENKLFEAIDLCNRERELFRGISLMRKSRQVPISSRDFIALNHGSFLADKRVMVDILESLVEELKDTTAPIDKGPRILLTGSTLAMGDSKVLDLTARAGGIIVNEEFAEGIRPYWTSVIPGDDLMRALIDGYFTRRIPPGWFRPGKERLDFLVKLARDFDVAGVIWYQLMYRESYKLESYYFPDILDRELGLPVLVVESDYDAAEEGLLETKVETFIESLRS